MSNFIKGQFLILKGFMTTVKGGAKMTEKQLRNIASIFLLSKDLVVIGDCLVAIRAMGLLEDFRTFLISYVTMS